MTRRPRAAGAGSTGPTRPDPDARADTEDAATPAPAARAPAPGVPLAAPGFHMTGVRSGPTAASTQGTATATLTGRDHPALTLAPREPITSLRFFGRELAVLPLPSSKRLFTIGAGVCDLVVPRELSRSVSGFHATLDRNHNAIHIQDQDTKNGTYRSLSNPRLASFQIQAGEVFWLADVPLIAMDTQLEVLRPQLAWCLGLERHKAIDEALEVVAEGRPVALLGPVGTDAARLAAAIHKASPQRNNFFLSVTTAPLPSLEHAHGGTVFLDLDQVKKVPAPYARILFEPSRSLRTIFAAADDRRLRARIDTYRDKVRTMSLVPLARRPEDFPHLLAIHWIDELRTRRRVEELGRGLGTIAAYDWPRNFDELREHAPRLLAYLEHEGLRPAAAALGIKHQTLSGHFRRIGFPVLDQADR
jgi:FHA domain